MKTKVLFLVLCLSALVSCNGKKPAENMNTNEKPLAIHADYVEAKGYFVKNTVADKQFTLNLTSQEDFDSYFGMATTMGKDGAPTAIDFEKQGVVAVIDSVSAQDAKIIANALTVDNGKLKLNYSIERGSDVRSYTSRACLILLVDKSEGTDATFEQK